MAYGMQQILVQQSSKVDLETSTLYYTVSQKSPTFGLL